MNVSMVLICAILMPHVTTLLEVMIAAAMMAMKGMASTAMVSQNH